MLFGGTVVCLLWLQVYGGVGPQHTANSSKTTQTIEACTALLGVEDYEAIRKNGRPIVPMPILDDSTNPVTIVMPSKEKTPLAGQPLVDFYLVTMECLKLVTAERHSVYKFNVDFLRWIIKNVLPRLSEHDMHLASAGISTIIDKMRELANVTEVTTMSPMSTEEQPTEGNGGEDEGGQDVEDLGRPLTMEEVVTVPGHKWYVYILANILAVICLLSWIATCCMCICLCCILPARINKMDSWEEKKLQPDGDYCGDIDDNDYPPSYMSLGSPGKMNEEELASHLSERLDAMALRMELLMAESSHQPKHSPENQNLKAKLSTQPSDPAS